MDPVVALQRLGGICPRGELRRLTTRSALARALADGTVVRLPRQQFGLPGLDAARVLAAAVGGSISHLSAAQHWGWKLRVSPRFPTVTVPRGRRIADHPHGRVVYADLPSADVVDGVTSPVRTVVDCARTLELRDALSVADSALRSGRVGQVELHEAAATAPRTGRARAVRIAREASALADNPFESSLRAIGLDVPGLSLRPQGWIGNIGRIDLVDERLLIAVEADSWEWHHDPQTFRRNIRRYTALARRGWVVARFDWEQVMSQPDEVRDALADLAAVRAHQLGARSYGSSHRSG